MTEAERSQEHAYLDQTEAVIRRLLDELLKKQPLLKEEVLTTRREIWDDNRHLIRDFDDVMELALQDREVNDAETRYLRNEEEIKRLERLKASPYFGRLDYEDAGRHKTVYIGIYTLRAGDPPKMLVVDWRAPVSSMFYGFDAGPAYFEPPSGRREVTLTRKRQYKIQDGRLLLMYDTDSPMFDEILGNVLSQNTGHSLKVIIGSIQKEQNAAIRSSPKSSCLIYGLAGSGKTSVGLHRLAYILYQDREHIKSENLLTVSNNAIFGSYISAILPDLGEKPPENLVFHDLLAEAAPSYEVEDFYAQLSMIESGSASERVASIGVKYSLEFIDFCLEHFACFPYRIPEVMYKGSPILSQEAFDARWNNRRFSTFPASLELAKETVREAVENFFLVNREAVCQDIEAESGQALPDREIKAIYKRTRRQYIATALEELARVNRLEPQMQAVDLLRDYLDRTGQSLAPALALFQAFQGRALLYEDALLSLFIQVLMGRVPARPQVRHVVIDEAQDYSPLQLAILKLLYPKSSFTLLADVFQAVNPATTTPDYRLFPRIFGPSLKMTRLDKCYRSSSEINALAFQLLREESPQAAEGYSYFARQTKLPQYIITADPLSQLPSLLARLSQYNSVAVITQDEARARQVKERLGGEVQLLVSADSRLTGRVAVLPLLLSKGLEFDAVILINAIAACEGRPHLYRRLYLGCTRALHELYLLEPRPLPPGLANCLPYVETAEPCE